MSNIVVPRAGFNTVVQTALSRLGGDSNSEVTIDVGTVGCGVFVPGTQDGLIVTGIHGSTDIATVWGAAAGVRLVILSLPGSDPTSLLNMVQNLNYLVGAYNAGSTRTAGGLVIPDLNTCASNPVGITGGGPGGSYPYAVLFDESTVPTNFGGSSGAQKAYFGDVGAIYIPPNTSVAGLFIAMRPYTDLPPDGLHGESLGNTVRGALMGRAASPHESAVYQARATGGGERTPGRFGNVAVPGVTQ